MHREHRHVESKVNESGHAEQTTSGSILVQRAVELHGTEAGAEPSTESPLQMHAWGTPSKLSDSEAQVDALETTTETAHRQDILGAASENRTLGQEEIVAGWGEGGDQNHEVGDPAGLARLRSLFQRRAHDVQKQQASLNMLTLSSLRKLPRPSTQPTSSPASSGLGGLRQLPTESTEPSDNFKTESPNAHLRKAPALTAKPKSSFFERKEMIDAHENKLQREKSHHEIEKHR